MATNNGKVAQSSTIASLGDGVLVGVAGWIAYYVRWDHWNMPLDYLSVLILGTGLILVILPLTGAYRSWRGKLHWRDTGNAVPGLFAVTVLLMIAGTLTKSTAEFSRLWMGYWFLFSLASLFSFRWLSSFILGHVNSREAPATRILVVGNGPFAESVAAKAEQADDANWRVVGLVHVDNDSSEETTAPYTAITLARMEELVSDQNQNIDEVWITMDNTALHEKKTIIDFLQSSCLTVRYVPDLSMLALLNHIPSEVAGMMVIDLNASPLTGPNSLIKAAVDVIVAVSALAILSPVFAIIALLIKGGSPGPIFFKQKRHGWDGKVINVLKFRSMRDDNAHTDGSKQAQRDDPRITRIGRFLRRTSLDELPQFINVLMGDMSVVGPRPHPVALNKNFVRRIDAYMQRHRVKPGITGWAQIHGLRGETETLDKMQQRVQYDLYYIEHWSLWLDIKIIARTLLGGWAGNNAY